MNKYHTEKTGYAFHFKNAQFYADLKNILKDIPAISDQINEKTYIVTRKVNHIDNKFSHLAHFDNYETSILIPLIIPNSAQNGDIVVWEKARENPSNSVFHFFSKLFFQNKLSTYIFKKLYLAGSSLQKFKRYPIKPGDYLVFDGFVDFHFNLPVDSGERLSLLIHNKKAFEDSIIVKMIEKYSQFSVR